jgi:hypothetical protein
MVIEQASCFGRALCCDQPAGQGKHPAHGVGSVGLTQGIFRSNTFGNPGKLHEHSRPVDQVRQSEEGLGSCTSGCSVVGLHSQQQCQALTVRVGWRLGEEATCQLVITGSPPGP